jgi:uncharacterized protein
MVSIFEDVSIITTSRKEKLNGIAFPVVAGTGGYFSKAEGFATILGGLKQLLLTNRGERVMLPDYGTNLRSYVFEQDTPQLRSKIKDEVYNAIAAYSPRVEISNYELLMRDVSGRNNILISLTLRLKNDYTQERILELII